MFKFFVPISKVQKDRRIMRETDARMAKYSRRGLIFNFCAYLICLMGGRFVDENRDLTIVLTIGLLAITLLRGVFLFGFENLYPRAPSRWRTNYFIATLLGAVWWGVILVSVTLKLQMLDEAPLLWLYTVVFFSTTAHAFAPYQKFLAYYQLIGLVPAAFSAFFIDSFDAYLYGVLLIAFYAVLTHQCRLISENYWERLEATFALSRKAQSLEEEKRDTKAGVQLNKEFMGYLNSDLQALQAIAREPFTSQSNVQELRSKHRTIQRKLNRIYANVNDFNNVITKELILKSAIFNVRHELQHIIADFVDEAEANGVLIESSLSPTLPMRLKGDASRFAQVVRTMLSICLQGTEKGIVLVDVEFLREYETAGELYITTSRMNHAQRKIFSNTDQKIPLSASNLSLAVAKGIADLMQGSIEVNEIPREGQQIRFNAKFDIAEYLGQLDFHRNSFTGHSVLLVHEHPRLVDVKRQELEALGFQVITETQYKRALQLLINSYKVGKRIESIVYYLNPNDDEALREFNQTLCEHPDLKFSHQIVAASAKQQKEFESLGYCRGDQLLFIDKPVGLFELELTFKEVFKSEREEILLSELNAENTQEKAIKLMFWSHREDPETFLRERLEQLPCDVSIAKSETDISLRFKGSDLPDVVLIDCDEEPNLIGIVDHIRKLESTKDSEMFIPVIGMSSAHDAKEIAAYEVGIDDFLELGNERHNLRAALEYWVSLEK